MQILMLSRYSLEWSNIGIAFYGLIHIYSKQWSILFYDDKKYTEFIKRLFKEKKIC